MKKLVLVLAACLGLVGCADEAYYDHPAYPPEHAGWTQHGCVVVTDEFGEREVCDTQYYYSEDGVTYWDAHFGIWVGPNGYWYGHSYFPGIYPGFHAYYHRGWYHPRGFYHGGYHGGGGGFHGGGFHGGGHGGHR